MRRLTDILERLDPRLTSDTLRSHDANFSIMLCSRFGRVKHVHITRNSDAGEPDPRFQQQLTWEQFDEIYVELLAVTSWSDALNIIGAVRAA